MNLYSVMGRADFRDDFKPIEARPTTHIWNNLLGGRNEEWLKISRKDVRQLTEYRFEGVTL